MTLKQTITTRMLKLRDLAISKGIVDTQKAWCDKIGFPSNNISNLRRGVQGFGHEHVYAAAKIVGASIDYVYGLSPTVARTNAPKSALELAHELVTALESKGSTVGKQKGKKGSI